MKLTHSIELGKECYYSNNKKPFAENAIKLADINNVLAFAYDMCFGDGHHRDRRTGGQYGRRNGEKFCNTFQGKLAEVVLYNFFTSKGLALDEPDFRVYGKGIWDDSDLVIGGIKINVKSAAFFSDLLLLETRDWDAQGHYIPNLTNGSASVYDYFILVRIKPDIKKIFSSRKMLYSDEITKAEIENIIFNETWFYDITGYITKADLVKCDIE